MKLSIIMLVLLLWNANIVHAQSDVMSPYAQKNYFKQNYPNPFNPTTTVPYYLSENSIVIITITNLIGQKMAELINEPQAQGEHSFEFDGSKFQSGIYWLKLETKGQEIALLKITLIK